MLKLILHENVHLEIFWKKLGNFGLSSALDIYVEKVNFIPVVKPPAIDVTPYTA